jgi:hypothetical protein
VNFHQFIYDLPWLAAFLACLLFVTFGRLVNLCSRILRTINVALRGWPPTHLDADGDFKIERDQDDD